MVVSKEDKDFMAGLLAKMNSIEDTGTVPSLPMASQTLASSVGNVKPMTAHDEAKQDMMGILSRLHAVTESAVTTPSNTVVEALNTQRTPSGSRIGSWEIRILDEERGDKIVKTYDVIHAATKEPIARALRLYEAAHGMVILLNRGETVNGRAIKELLELEETYTRNFIDAQRFRKLYHNAERTKNTVEADIMESRYQASRQHALKAKDRITNLYESL